MWEMSGDADRGDMLTDEFQTVTAADVQRLAQTYLTERTDRRALVRYNAQQGARQ
jgi:hypothetical protein